MSAASPTAAMLAANDASSALAALRVFGAAVLVIGFGLLATTNLFYRMQRNRLGAALIAGGLPAIIAGWAIGPGALRVVDDDTILLLRPLLMGCLGWVGVIVGMQLRREVLKAVPRQLWRWAVLDSLLSGGAAALLGAAILAWWFPADARTVGWLLVPAVLLGCATMGWLPETRSLRVIMSPRTQQLALFIQGGSGIAAVLAILVYGVVSQLVDLGADGRPGLDPLGAGGDLLLTVALSAALGLGGGHLLALAGRRRGALLVVFLGIVGLSAGVAADLAFSPLLTAMLCGALLANRAADALPSFELFIMRAEHVVALLLGLLAGVLITPALDAWGWLLVLMLVVVRLVLKPALARRPLAAVAHAEARRSPLRLAPLRQSPLATVLGVGLVLAFDAPVSRALLTVIVFAGVLSDVVPLLIGYYRRAQAGAAPIPGGAA